MTMLTEKTLGSRTVLPLWASRKKVFLLIAIVIFIVLFFTIREKYFYRTDALKPILHLSHKTKSNLDIQKKVWGFFNFVGEESEVVDQRNAWDLWMDAHPQLTSIGDIYDKCDNQTRNKVGKVVLEPIGKESVQIISYTNQTYKFDITKATSHMKVFYDEDLFYENDYDVCEQVEMLETPYHCPLIAGKEIFIRSETKMPSYIPKGRYTVEVSVRNQDDIDIGCTFVEFKTGEEEH